MLTLMERAGDSAINDLWHSVAQLVTNNPQLHGYAARRALEALRRGASYEVFVKATGWLLGEHGPGLAVAGEAPLLDQFRLLQERFVAASPETKVGGGPRLGAAAGGSRRGLGCRDGLRAAATSSRAARALRAPQEAWLLLARRGLRRSSALRAAPGCLPSQNAAELHTHTPCYTLPPPPPHPPPHPPAHTHTHTHRPCC
jgi:hypothetical protein